LERAADGRKPDPEAVAMNRKTPEPEWSEDILQYLAVAVMFAAILVIAMRLIDWAMSW
jgi:hypothetical protein